MKTSSRCCGGSLSRFRFLSPLFFLFPFFLFAVLFPAQLLLSAHLGFASTALQREPNRLETADDFCFLDTYAIHCFAVNTRLHEKKDSKGGKSGIW